MDIPEPQTPVTGAGEPPAAIALPPELVAQLKRFRGRVRRVRLLEAGGAALCGLGLAWAVVFVSDRLGDPPRGVRWAAFALALGAGCSLPLAVGRWVVRWRSLAQAARLIARRYPALGDELLGAIDIVQGTRGAGETRSRQLCAAAVAQVARQAARHDFGPAVPRPRDRLWLGLAAGLAVPVALAAARAPAAAANAWLRLLAPGAAIERYTFTRLVPPPDALVVPLGEPAAFGVELADTSLRRPARGRVRIAGQAPLAAPLEEGHYRFALPPQLADTGLTLAVGDARHRIALQPLVRPEIAGVVAEVTLPDYLGRPEPLRLDVRGGTVTPVHAARVRLVATATRELAAATVDGTPLDPVGARIETPPRVATEETRLSIEWRDRHGLAGPRPLVITMLPRPDEPPTVTAPGLPSEGDIVLRDDTLRFTVVARDDFGVARVGLEWRPEQAAADAPGGERLLEAGGPERTVVEAAATFCPDACGIPTGPVLLGAYAEDFLPDRGRVRTPPRRIHVVDRAEHALVLMDRLTRWRAEASEARDRELNLLAANKELRDLAPERLLEPAVRERLERQASAEESQARRVDRLVDQGSAIVREAFKNPEFEAATLERLAEDVTALGEIANARMPGVAELLRQAARARRATPVAAAAPPRPGLPSVTDVESTQQPSDSAPPQPPCDCPPRLGLPTTVAGTRPSAPAQPAAEPPAATEALAEAITAQEKLLADFARVADDIAQVMASLEGSTFVKRLKLASREQTAIGGRIAGLVGGASGTDPDPPGRGSAARDVAAANARETDRVSHLLDDLQAYFDRRQLPSFRTVLEEMRQLDVLGSLRQQSDDIPKEAGLSIAQAEFWSDTFDRLADDLVPREDPDASGRPHGRGGPRPSVPPEVILEVLRILESETNLREETRVTQQTKPAASAEAFARNAAGLAERQQELADRVERLAGRLLEERDGARAFVRELRLFDQVNAVMEEATGILRTPETGPSAIAAESEAIELLLAAQAGGGGGGGGGGAAGLAGDGGSTGSTTASALALIGDSNRTRRAAGPVERGQATGGTDRVLPEEFRAGLDAYFNRLEVPPR